MLEQLLQLAESNTIPGQVLVVLGVLLALWVLYQGILGLDWLLGGGKSTVKDQANPATFVWDLLWIGLGALVFLLIVFWLIYQMWR